MQLTPAHISKIRAAFDNMQSKEDLLTLLNEAKPFVYGEQAVPFELKQLTWYANPELGRKRYKLFTIKKKSGSDRQIHAPVEGLKALQKTLAFILQCVFTPHQAATGFVWGKSIVDNAKLHAGSNYVYNIDLKDFFPSIDQARVWACLQLKPFDLFDETKPDPKNLKTNIRRFRTSHGETIFYRMKNREIYLVNDKRGNLKKYEKRIAATVPSEYEGQKIGLMKMLDHWKRVREKLSEDAGKYIHTEENETTLGRLLPSRLTIANMMASICCTKIEVERMVDGKWVKEKRNVLPQGAPTSPVITNMVCQRLDFLLTSVANRFGLRYSRYADDITFSSMHNVYQTGSDFLSEVQRIIAQQGFHIKESKTRLQKEGYRQEVTGLLVNRAPNVQHRYIKQLRMWLYHWERYGYSKAWFFFRDQYVSEASEPKRDKPDMKAVVAGKLDFLKMVRGAENKAYLKLKERFELLKSRAEVLQEYKDIRVSDEPEENPVDSLKQIDEVSTEQEKGEVKKSDGVVTIFHKPAELVGLLKNFSLNGGALKYATHSWDAGRDAVMFSTLPEFLGIALKHFDKFSFDLKKLSNNLNGKIYSFLFREDIGKTGWGGMTWEDRLYFGWSSPELLEACATNPSLNPEDFILPVKYQRKKDGITLHKFRHIIDVFKNQIEIRDENTVLQQLIIGKHNKYLSEFDIDEAVNLDNKTFYTDVQWLSKALDMIFEGIQSRTANKRMSYKVIDDRADLYVLEILHIDSFNRGKSIYDEKLQIGRGNFGEIGRYLENLCDWSIESQFMEGCYRINYLSSNKDVSTYEELKSAPGFKHVLTFYK